MRKTRVSGFTLIELLIAVAVIGILLAIAVPAYTDQVRKTRRAQAKADLQELTQVLERRYTLSNAYNDPAFVLPFAVSPRLGAAFYDITAVVAANTFTLTATPSGDQAEDRCSAMTINQTGVTTPTTDGCWN